MRDRLTILDSLKGIAAIGIFCIHIGVNNKVFVGRLGHLFSYGNRGVEITYIVSAFLLSGQYYKNYTDTKYPINLLVKNIVNVVPIFYLSIACAEVVNIVINGCSLPIKTIISNLLFLSVFNDNINNNIGGSLYFSCLFFTWILYLVYIKYVDNLEKSIYIGLINVFLAMYIVPGVASFLLTGMRYDNVFYLCRCVGSFGVGHMLYYIVHSNKFKSTVISKEVQIVSSIFLACVVYFDGMKDKIFTFVIISALLLINFDAKNPLINNVVLKYLGKRILQIYCWHIVLGELLKEYMIMDMKFFLLVVILTLFLSEITYQIDTIRRQKMNGLLIRQ